MTDALPFSHVTQQPGRIRLWLTLLAYLLIGIRFVAEFGCYACFMDWEIMTGRTVHIHAASSSSHCHHSNSTVSPFVAWACAVNPDDQTFLLPDILHLPVLVSFFVIPVRLLASYPGRPLVVAHGRGPPFSPHIP